MNPTAPRSQWKALFFGGLLPILAFTIIEEFYGPVWGTVAGLVFGAGEIIYEYTTQKRVSNLTIVSNCFIFVLGMIAIWTQEGIWFKLQPAFLVFALAIWFFLTSFRGPALLTMLAKKQNPNLPAPLEDFFNSLNLRLGICLVAIGALSVYAAFYWTTPAWAFLKGVGAPALMLAYMVIELLIFRLRR